MMTQQVRQERGKDGTVQLFRERCTGELSGKRINNQSREFQT